MLGSLTAIWVKPHQCPSHQSILLIQGLIHEIFTKKYLELAILKNSVFFDSAILNLFFSKKIFFGSFLWKQFKVYWLASNGSKFWSSQTWKHFLTHAKHFEGECMSNFLIDSVVLCNNWYETVSKYNYLIFRSSFQIHTYVSIFKNCSPL